MIRVQTLLKISLTSLALSAALLSPTTAQVEAWGDDAPPAIRKAFQVKDPALYSLLERMTWEEKCGQLTQYAGELTGPQPIKAELFERISTGEARGPHVVVGTCWPSFL